MQKMRRFLAAILVAMTVLSCNVTSFAAKPSVARYKCSTSIKRGKSVNITYRLSSGSYKMKNNRYRAVFMTVISYKKSSNTVGYWNPWFFTGTGNRTYTFKSRKSLNTYKTGKYIISYAIGHHSKGLSKSQLNAGNVDLSKWKIDDSRYFTIRVK